MQVAFKSNDQLEKLIALMLADRMKTAVAPEDVHFYGAAAHIRVGASRLRLSKMMIESYISSFVKEKFDGFTHPDLSFGNGIRGVAELSFSLPDDKVGELNSMIGRGTSAVARPLRSFFRRHLACG